MRGRMIYVGDVMTDITALLQDDVATGSDARACITMQPGGAAANSARWSAWLGFSTVLLAAVGDDDAGQALQAQLRSEGVDPRLSVRSGMRTGACVVIVGTDGERTMLPDSGANASLQAVDLDLTTDDHVHISGYSLFHDTSRTAAMSMIAQARHAGASVSLDPASTSPMHRHLTAVREACQSVDVILANQPEAALLSGESDPEQAAVVLQQWCRVAVVKKGGAGVTAAVDDDVLSLPAHGAHVVDTTGAGDAFAAGFLATWHEGSGLHEALTRGQLTAAEAISRVGAGPPPGAAGRIGVSSQH